MKFKTLVVVFAGLSLSACAAPPQPAPHEEKCPMMSKAEEAETQVGRYQLTTTGNGIYLITDTVTGKLWYYNIAPGKQEWTDISPPFTHAPTTQISSLPDVEAEPVLTTEALESGKLKITDVPATSLEALLQDLNRRKDMDYAAHDGQPGPDAAYLWTWVQNVTAELESRGYYFDESGNLHGRGTVIALR